MNSDSNPDPCFSRESSPLQMDKGMDSGLLSKWTCKNTHATAVAVFSRGPDAEIRHRGWNKNAQALFRIPSVSADLREKADLHLFIDNPVPETLQADGYIRHFQSGGNFKSRLINAIEDLTREGYERIILVGTDCPALDPADLDTAYEALQGKRAVIGPDHRGGMYLIGFHTGDRHYLKNIVWCRNRDAMELYRCYDPAEVHLLETKADVDTIHDLELLSRDPQLCPGLRQLALRVLYLLRNPAHVLPPSPLRRSIRYWIRRMLKYRDAPPEFC